MSDGTLFDPATHAAVDVSTVDNSAVEHTTLPEAAECERTPALSVLCDTAEQRDELVAHLGLVVRREGERWVTWWPTEPDDRTLTLGF